MMIRDVHPLEFRPHRDVRSADNSSKTVDLQFAELNSEWKATLKTLTRPNSVPNPPRRQSCGWRMQVKAESASGRGRARCIAAPDANVSADHGVGSGVPEG